MAAVRASTRVSIAWKGAPAYEDTDTLVLTIHDYSLDLRVFVTGAKRGQIDWSTVARVHELEGSTLENPVLGWHHIIDSRPPSGEADQGTFATLENGDVTETGRMYNPDTGEIEAYVETWRRKSLDPAVPYCVLELVDTDGGTGFIGRVGNDTLSCARTGDGDYLARRHQDGSAIWAFGHDLDDWLPPLPTDLPPEWQAGDLCHLGGRQFMVRLIGPT